MMRFTLAVDADSTSSMEVQAIRVSIHPTIPEKPVQAISIRVSPGESKVIELPDGTSLFIHQSIHKPQPNQEKP